VDFEIAVIAVGLARQQAFELALGGFRPQFVERGLGFRDDALVALGLAQFDELDRVAVVLLDALIPADQIFQPAALARDLLRRLGVVPEIGRLDLFVQLGETAVRDIPVKDASAAGRAISGCRRRWPGFPRA
jgi:hypothetical protein